MWYTLRFCKLGPFLFSELKPNSQESVSFKPIIVFKKHTTYLPSKQNIPDI